MNNTSNMFELGELNKVERFSKMKFDIRSEHGQI